MKSFNNGQNLSAHSVSAESYLVSPEKQLLIPYLTARYHSLVSPCKLV